MSCPVDSTSRHEELGLWSEQRTADSRLVQTGPIAAELLGLAPLAITAAEPNPGVADRFKWLVPLYLYRHLYLNRPPLVSISFQCSRCAVLEQLTEGKY